MRQSRHRARPLRSATRAFLGTLVAGTLLAGPVDTTAAADGAHGSRATLRYTEHGIPHILADNFRDLGYGYGYAVARDNICELADIFLTVGAERSRHFGPGGAGNSTLSYASSNLDSDLYFQRIIDSGVVERLAARPAPHGPRPEVREMASGYAEGFNRYLTRIGRDNLTDPRCRGAAWVRRITETDVYRVTYALTTLSGQGALADGITAAKPAGASGPAVTDAEAAGRLAAGFRATRGDGELGSNGIALGADAVAEGSSVLMGNPHFPWRGAGRFWQTHLTVPGELDVSGAGLLGTPLLQKGHNENVAWTHSLSTAQTIGLYEVKLVPGSPTSYLVDGERKEMTSRTVRVRFKGADGELHWETRTFYETVYGPMLTSVTGTPLPWTGESGYALRDVNATNMRALDTWFGIATADDTDEVRQVLATTLGAPWVNTMATDRYGDALYANIQAVPHVTDELAARCNTPLGRTLFQASGVSVLDGSVSSCRWGSDPDALEPGMLGPGRMAVLKRRDYVLNSNDSPWLANLRAPLTGHPRIIGDTGTPRSMRTREALATVEEALSGEDFAGFTRESVQDMLLAGRSRLAVLAAADTARMCAAFPDGMAPSSQGPVDVGRACGALASWDHRYTLDSRGSLLFQRFGIRLGKITGTLWNTPFDPRDPIATPRSLNTANPAVQRAFGDAAAELHAAGIPLDAELGRYQREPRGEERIPLPGAPDALGVLNLTNPQWDPRRGMVGVRTGSSYIQVVGYDEEDPCPRAATLLTYSQSSDPASPHYADQTRMYSEGRWVTGRFCEKDILSSPNLEVVHLY